MASAWNFAIDRGGTFTDVIAWTDEGSFRTEKLLSENPDHYADAAIEGIGHGIAIFAPVVTSWFGHRFLTFR